MAAAPVLPPGMNTAPRVTVTGAAHRAVPFAPAELNPTLAH